MSWRDRLRPAFFRGVPFHVDEDEINGGRRVVPHEYPKRNTGYSEDMGRRLRAYRVRGYLIGADYDLVARLMLAALEADGSGLLVLPLVGEDTVLAVNFSYVETREEGGYGTFDMDFIQEGQPVAASAGVDTGAAVNTAADAVKASTASSPMKGAFTPSGIGSQ
ncbi:MAG TPA: DNA circularization N-terminal domain-containing protein [Kaistia sp.]|nr:DNA circularization N-terminal domain-containing protein [Kaistia sp.]